MFPESAHKIRVNPNIISVSGLTPPVRNGTSKKIRLVFIGMLKVGVRTPERLLHFFSALKQNEEAQDAELHFYGGLEYCDRFFAAYRHLIGNSLFLHGVVPRTVAIDAMTNADVLVNIGNSNPFQEPSKVIEYASTGKPILNVASIQEDTSARVLNEYPAAFNVYLPDDTIDPKVLMDFVEFLRSLPSVDAGFLQPWLQPYTAEAVVDGYEIMLSE